MKETEWWEELATGDFTEFTGRWVRHHVCGKECADGCVQDDLATKQGEKRVRSDMHSSSMQKGPDREWMENARCAGMTHKMFPREHKDITYIQEARLICADCKVQKECLDYALSFPSGDMHGVWASLTPRQLAAEQRKQKIRPTVPTLAQMWSDLTRG